MRPGTRPPDLRTAYLSGGLEGFFQISPGDTDAALGLRRDVDRAALAAAIRPHAERLGASARTLASLEKLARPGSLAVVTGQQAGLLLGPMYTLAKAMTAVRLAARLSTEERPVVPVFWVATQDHDVAEVDHAYLLDGSETLRRAQVALPEGVAVGRLPLRPDMLAAVEGSLAAHTPRPPCEGEVVALLRGAAERSRGFADWFAAQLYRLLGDTGIVVVDPLEPAVAALFAGVLERELADPLAGPARVNEAGKGLRRLGFAPQLGRGEGATNLFVELPGDGELPRRQLLRAEDGAFVAGGVRLTREDLLARLRDDPTSLTPAAGLRPVVQDALLPTAVAVLGPGELAYVAQLRGVYELHGVPMPLAWPRATVTVIEPAAARLLAVHGLTAARLRDDPEGELERVLLARHGAASAFNRATNAVEKAFDELLAEVDAIDPTLRGTVKRGRRNLDVTLSRLRGKTAAALARRDAETRRQFERLRAHLLPLGQPAERVLSPYSHALKFGLTPLLDRLSQVGESGEHELYL
ncbi:MAG TPA: bacillithiol biosynthesis cysteine-adding enzyme BshC [Trueperaceae bacterium]|nr:bacillithiol biosynthesis cysteine-adding enzyme BshC [Trueperaceae bacterium]